ncbi:lipase family protein [Mycobacterium sp. OTB74]|uniref:lipase family protein n=1 Tax=Mycobacterium sp. OTB74 TaxID=1853452 RepID=UPI002475E4C6|nr:lipase family protein [Mycobacterium sp. OTB74]MDH6246204.1 alpha-beta hydrolase superfamily lysophospholipase [Mycobacterium sp. OTB74]
MGLGNTARATDAEWIGHPYHEELQPGTRPQLPADDYFYVAPVGFEHTRPGTVLRSREVELGFMGLIPQHVTATQLLYRSTDVYGAPCAAVTTVLMPAHRPINRPCPIVSYQCAIDAVSGRSFPSYAMRLHARGFGNFTQFEYLFVAAAVAQGWAVSVPDHEGIDGLWGTPHEPGYHVLDGLRAALNTESLGLSRTAPIGLWGYSGGGLASAWAAEELADYAPELNIVGAVLGSPVGDLGNTFQRLNGTFFAGLPATVIAALTHIYPGLDRVINDYATDEGKAMLHNIEGMSTLEAIVRHAYLDMDNLLARPLQQVIDTPEVQEVFDEIRLGGTIPSVPMLIVQAAHDQIISVDDIDALAYNYATGGADMTYHRDIFAEHIVLHPLSAPMAMRWLGDRFAGRSMAPGSRNTYWPTLLNPATYVGMAKLCLVSAKVLFGIRP